MSAQQSPTKTRERSRILDTHLQGRWLVLSRGVWLALVILTLSIFGASLPLYVAQLQTACAGTVCQYQQLTHSQVETLKGIGMPLSDYTAYTVALAVAYIILCLSVSTLIVWHRSDDRMAMLVALMLVALGPITITATFPPSSPSPWQVPNRCLLFLFNALFLLVFSLFPSAQFVPRWTRWILVVILAVQVPANFFPDAPLIPNILVGQLGWLVAVGEMVTLALIQLYRYQRVSNPTQRQQTKWVVFGIAVPITVDVIVTGQSLLFPALAEHSSLYLLAFNESGFLLALFIPLAFGLAMLRYRLWEIDTIINRTLVYGALTVSVVSMYVLIVSMTSMLFHPSSTFLSSLLATGLIAVLFQPLHARLQRTVNRLIYGERDDPYAVLARLGSRLEVTLIPDAVLPTVVQTVAQALKLPYAAITLKNGEMFAIAASHGLPQHEIFTLPLVYHGETVGQLQLAPRGPNETFTAADRRLLSAIASHVGVAAHAVRLTADLQRSRERLVTTREEERRRLRRDLHDGLGPTLASMTLKLDAARNLLSQNSPALDPLLCELKLQTQTTIADIRRLVYDLRPPALDELGLISALREQIVRYSQVSGVQMVIEAPSSLPALPAAVEVATYRIVLEAVTNVVRHAQAHMCRVRLQISDVLTVEVSDDGVGLPIHYAAGVGISSMRERTAELGGTCRIEPNITEGTHILVRLPLAKE